MQRLTIKRIVFLLCGVGLLFLTSCVPRVEQSQDLASFLPFRVDLLDVTDSQGTTTNAGFWKIKPDEQVEISMQVQNLTSQAIRIDVSSPTFMLIVNPVNQKPVRVNMTFAVTVPVAGKIMISCINCDISVHCVCRVQSY